MVSLGQELNDRQLQKMMNEMDLDNTGSIEFEEFAVVMAKRMAKEK
jgi:Ca2+-binding EF-hand superfamily protein